MSETNKMSVDYSAEAFAYGIGVKPITSYDFTYNRQQNFVKDKHKKINLELSITSIFPVEYLNTFFINKKEYEHRNHHCFCRTDNFNLTGYNFLPCI
jgi:hypothetical protein